MISVTKSIFYRLLLLFFSAGTGMILLCIVYLLPEDKMFLNAKQSSQILSEEGSYPIKWGEEIGSTLDNFTDALMIQNAICPSSGNLLKDAISVNHIQYTTMKPVEDLASEVSLKAGGYSQEYMRYWHGYLLFLKPLLLITDYQGIRLLNIFLQLFLIFYLLYSIYRKGLQRFIIPFIVSWLGIAPWVIPYSMQLSTMYYISVIGSIFLFLLYDKLNKHSFFYYFMFLGILTSYFDYLTYPLLSLGLPLIFYLLMNIKSEKICAKNLFSNTFLICINWGIGYGGMWASKWLISELFLSNGAISQAIGAALYRSSTSDEGAGVIVTPSLIWTENIKRLFNPAFCIGLLVFMSILLIYIGYHIYIKQIRFHLFPAYFFLFIAVFPLIWYALLKNHSFVHLSLVYRSLWISIFAGMCFLVNLSSPSSNSSNNSI